MTVAEVSEKNLNYKPEETSRNAFERQSRTKPAAENHVFDLTFGNDKPMRIVARDDNEAWAKFCDGRGQYPSRRRSLVKIVDVGPVSKVQAEQEAATEARQAAGDIAGKLESLGV